MQITPGTASLGAAVSGLDLAVPLGDDDLRTLLRALARYGVLRFPAQNLTPEHLAAFGARFGPLERNVANIWHAPGLPEVMILSNVVEDGKQIGLPDAGQDWHTDMSYSREIALATVLHAKKIPVRDGKVLGDTQFRDMRAAYQDLPAALKARLAGKAAIHDFAKFWDMMRERPGSTRQPLSERQRDYKPPVAQPIFRRHPVSGEMVLYCNPGYAMRIEGMDEEESGETLEFLFRHQAQDKYLYAHRWTVGDVLMWDDIATTHNAVADYRSDEPRFMYRVQVIAAEDYPILAA